MSEGANNLYSISALARLCRRDRATVVKCLKDVAPVEEHAKEKLYSLHEAVPAIVAGALAALALLPRVGERARRLLLVVAGLAFLVNAGVAVYHVGVEQKWWVSGCVPTEDAAVQVTDLAAMMAKPVEARCDEPAWEFHGITMAAMNIPFSAGLALVTLLALGLGGRRDNR